VAVFGDSGIVFPEIAFQGELRPSQSDVVRIAEAQLAAGQRRLHIVAPPGSGKTVLGLYLWAHILRCPAVVFAPNSAIQAQWAARVSLFDVSHSSDATVSTSPNAPALLTSLTYQSVTLPSRGRDLDQEAIELWIDRLITSGQALDPREASLWVNDLRKRNRDYYEQRLGIYRKQARDTRALQGDALSVLHQSARSTWHRLREHGVQLIILDECHHLMGHWGRVLADAQELFQDPVILGLTATPPDRKGQRVEDIERYDAFFGPIDYEVPVPAVVKDGFLAPYQDLAYFVRPSADELNFIATADDQLLKVLDELCQPLESPAAAEAIGSQETHDTNADSRPADAADTDSADPDSADPDTDDPDTDDPDTDDPDTDDPDIDSRTADAPDTQAADADGGLEPVVRRSLLDWVAHVLEHRLLPTGAAKDWNAFERRDEKFAAAAPTLLILRGRPLPDEVPHPHQEPDPDQPLDLDVIVPVLDRYIRHHLRRSEHAEDQARARRLISRLRLLGIQVTETGSQPCASPVGRVLAYADSKALALIPILLREMQALGPSLRAVVVADYEKTSAVSSEVEHLLDDEAGGAIAAFQAILSNPETDTLDPILLTGSSVLVDDDLLDRFREAAERWLIEGGYEVTLSYGEEIGFHVVKGRGADWAPRVYVEMITDLFQQGLTRCLVGTRGLLGEGWDANKINVLVDLTTVTTSMSVNQLRGRSIRLNPEEPEKLADNWDVVCIAPEFSKGLDDYRRFRRKHRAIFGVTDDGAIEKGVGHVHAAFTSLRPGELEGSVGLLNSDMLQRASRRGEARALWKIGQPYHADPIKTVEARPATGGGFPPFAWSRTEWTEQSLTLAVGRAVLGALQECRLMQLDQQMHVGERDGGYLRLFLEESDETDNELFCSSLKDALGPLDQPRYVIPRQVDRVTDTLLSRWLPSVIGRYFQQRDRKLVMLHAVPTELARKRELVEVFQRHWNQHVSPGEAVYAHRDEGRRLIQDARQQKITPRNAVRDKEIFRC